ncbi:hypothetical protein EJ08DRAFT_646350 [Tothia fuscella]|uniref:Uncharacterized protein n=1 Tax=Tothia fuscella TaxID=1048955 RepID=A0A9P4P0A4_9PEZI|nr:hypothetical protein EJ08DRAFT_646350 [Tothia fuscella]
MERREEKKKARILAAAAAITERYKKRNEKLEQKLEKKMSVLSVPATNLEIKSPTTSEESKKKQEPEAEALPSDYLAVFALGVLLAITIVILWDLLSNLRNPFR